MPRCFIGLCPPYCNGCYYLSREMRSCDYILITGHPRGCPSGNGCTKRFTGAEAQQYRVKHDEIIREVSGNKKRLSIKEHNERLGYYHRGMIDREIAELCGVTKSSITRWRIKHNLPAHKEPDQGGPK